MRRNIRSVVTFGSLLALAILVIAGNFSVAYGQIPSPPPVNPNYLGGSSYNLFYGLNPNPVAPGPPTSDPPNSPGPPPTVGPNVRVNAPQAAFPFGLLGRSETTIAQSGNGNFMVVGFNDAQGFCGFPFGVPCTPEPSPGLSGYAFSTDRGQTWTDPGIAPVFGGTVVTIGDPSLDVGGHGNDTFFYANLAFQLSPFADGISVHRGSFSASSFSWGLGATFIPAPPGGFLDKELLAADKNGSRPNVYVSATNFGPPFFNGEINAFSSTDGGVTFTGAIVHAGEATVVNQGSQPAVGPDGTVYVAWERGWLSGIVPEIGVAKSTDFGATWGSEVVVSQICSMAFTPPNGYNRFVINDFPRIAVAETGPHRGRVYVAYQDARVACGGVQPGFITNQNTDVYVRFSDDKGATWSAATLVASGADPQFFPVVSVEDGGNVDVLYYDQTAGTPLVNTLWAQSTDGGVTFGTPVMVSTATSNWSTTATNIIPNFGDYITAVSGGNKIFATWADGRNGVPDTFYATIHGAGKSK